MINMNEETFFEGGPAKSDLIINLIAGVTILGQESLPLQLN